MKGVLVLLVAVNIGAALSLKALPYRLRQVSNVSVADTPESRIYRGIEALEGQFPFMVYVLMKMGDQFNQCSASLISPDWVLTAAHCVCYSPLPPENILLIGGRANVLQYVMARLNDFYTPIDEYKYQLQERRAKKYFYHPEFDQNVLYHDVALIKVAKPFVVNTGKVTVIPISEEKMTSPRDCTILGWGLTLGNHQTFKLNYATDKRVTTTALGCLHMVKGPFICLNPDRRGICQGDSGSPLLCGGAVWGVASHLVSYSGDPDCGDSLEEYYSELYNDLNWIKSVYSSGNLNNMAGMRNLLLCVFVALCLSRQM